PGDASECRWTRGAPDRARSGAASAGRRQTALREWTAAGPADSDAIAELGRPPGRALSNGLPSPPSGHAPAECQSFTDIHETSWRRTFGPRVRDARIGDAQGAL